MAEDDWWAQAVDQFGLEVDPEPSPARSTVITAQEIAPTVPTPRARRRRAGVDWLVLAIASLAAAFLLRTFVIQQFAVDGESTKGKLTIEIKVLSTSMLRVRPFLRAMSWC